MTSSRPSCVKIKSTRLESKLSSFKPVVDSQCRVLILGSMPGIQSLQAQAYYAHPRNAFWKIIQALFDIDIKASYSSRYSALLKSNIALWDTLESCQREGSLDAKIDRDSEVANDFLSLLGNAPSISHIFFNGAKSESAFKKHVAKELLKKYPDLHLIGLPSTSPAHASLSFEGKLNGWSEIKRVLE